jgi:PAS domain S-box-containing protein
MQTEGLSGEALGMTDRLTLTRAFEGDPWQIIADLQRKLDARTAELQEKNERYALVSQAVAEGIFYDWDIADNALWVSPRLIEIFGLVGGSLSAADWNARVHPDDFEHDRTALRDCFKAVTARLHCEYRIQLTNGEYRWVEDHGLPTRDGTGRAVRLVGAVSDITERKEADQALREALEQQTATAEVLQVINSSPADLTPVFEAILDKAHVLCGATLGTLFLYDGEKNRAAATHGYPEELADELRRGVGIFPNSGPAALLAGARLVHRPDITQVGDPVARAVSRRGGVRTNLLVPLRKDGAFLGMISCNRKEVRPFSEKQIALLENFAAQAVIAMENARLLGELQQRIEELAARNSEFGERIEHQSATIDVLKVMSASPGDPQPVFDLIVRRARDLCNTPNAGLFEFDGELVHLRSWVGREAYGTLDAVEAYERLFPMVPTREVITCRAILDRQIIHVRDMASEAGVSAAVRNLGHKSQISVPLLRDGAAIGAVGLTSGEIDGFTDSRVALLQTFAEQAVIAIISAETYRALQQRTGDLQESLEYQTATSDVVKVISQSTFDLDTVLQTVVAAAHRLCRSDYSVIFRKDGNEYRWAAGHGISAEYEERERRAVIRPGHGTIIGRAVLAGHAVQIADARTDPLYEGEAERDARTMLGVPLLRDGEAIGGIGLARNRVEVFTDREIELVTTFADQSAIAIENARLLTKTREALEQQTATAEVLQVINSSPGDLAPVFEAMLEKALHLCEATFGRLSGFDGQRFPTLAVRGVSGAGPQPFDQAIAPDPGSALERIATGDLVVHIADLVDTEAYRAGVASRRYIVEAHGARTALWVALRKDDAILGVFIIYRQEVRPFSDKQIALLQNFAAQAVIAMENARLLTELRERTSDLQESLDYQTAISDVLKVISQSTFDLQPVFETIADTAARLCDAEMALLTNREGDAYRVVTTFATSPEFVMFMRGRLLTASRGSLAGRTVLEGRVVHITDIASDPEYTLPEVVTLGKARTGLGAPLLRDGVVVGTINLARQRVQPFTERQIELVRTFADQAVIAIENARLLEEIRQRQAELRVTFDNMGDGVAMFDAELRLAAWNRNFQRILDLPDDFVGARPSPGRVHPLSHEPERIRRRCRSRDRGKPPDGNGWHRLVGGAHTTGWPGHRNPPQPGAIRRLCADL